MNYPSTSGDLYTYAILFSSFWNILGASSLYYFIYSWNFMFTITLLLFNLSRKFLKVLDQLFILYSANKCVTIVNNCLPIHIFSVLKNHSRNRRRNIGTIETINTACTRKKEVILMFTVFTFVEDYIITSIFVVGARAIKCNRTGEMLVYCLLWRP